MSATVIHVIRKHCQNYEGTVCGMFYFTFSDKQKQSYEDCLRSLVTQITTQEPALSMLVKLHRPSHSSPGIHDLEQILLTAVNSHIKVFIVLDALDESPEVVDGNLTVRQRLMNELVRLSKASPKLSLLITSRDLVEIRRMTSQMGVLAVSMVPKSINRDILQYIRSQIAGDVDLARLDETVKEEIETVMSKSDGM